MSSNALRQKSVPYLMILPAFILILYFKMYPIVSTLLESLFDKGQFTLKVYNRVLGSSQFWQSLWITIKLNLVMIPLQVFISFCLALLSNARVKGIGGFRTVFFLPFTISLTIASIIWGLMFNTNNGVINSMIGFLGIPSQRFLVDKNQALWCIVVIASWKGCGYWMMFFLAGLKNIDTSIYESAKMDGAGFFRTLFSITIPLIKKVTLFIFVANTTANILLFVPIQMLTEGGPQGSTNVLMYEAYKSAFRYADRPRSAVIVTVLLLMIALVSIFQFMLLHEKDERKEKAR